MTSREPDDKSGRGPDRTRQNWVDRRRKKIADEVERNRRGEYRVPTWVLAVALALIVGGWLALVLLS
jgi:hypothetical protein